MYSFKKRLCKIIFVLMLFNIFMSVPLFAEEQVPDKVMKVGERFEVGIDHQWTSQNPDIVKIDYTPCPASLSWTHDYAVAMEPGVATLTSGQDKKMIIKVEQSEDQTPRIIGYIAPDFDFTSISQVYLSGFNVTIDGTDITARTDSDGYFELKKVPLTSNNEVCTVKISKPGYLMREISVLPVKGTYAINSKSTPIKILPGDMPTEVCDNAVNMKDVMMLAINFNKEIKYLPEVVACDIWRDNVINMNDIILLAKAFNKTTKDYPPLVFMINGPVVTSTCFAIPTQVATATPTHCALSTPTSAATATPKVSSIPSASPTSVPTKDPYEKWIPYTPSQNNVQFSLLKDSLGDYIAVVYITFPSTGFRASAEPNIIPEVKTEQDGSVFFTLPANVTVEQRPGPGLTVLTSQRLEFNLGNKYFGERLYPTFVLNINGKKFASYDLNNYLKPSATPTSAVSLVPTATPTSLVTKIPTATPTSKPVKQVSARAAQTLVLYEDGTVGAFGNNEYDQCNVPEDLKDVIIVAGGCTHSVALKKDGTIVAWGEKMHGECKVPENLNGVKAISAGAYFTAALKDDGNVVVWGSDYQNVCNIPEGLRDVKAIAAGDSFMLALKKDGTVVSWGRNLFGECDVPEGLNDVIAISAGGIQALALKSDGTVVTWGGEEYGMENIPEGLTDVVAVAAGGCHSSVLKKDGTIISWGENSFGQCNIPEGLEDIKEISAGGAHTVVLKNDGTVLTWGSNQFGQSDVR